MGMPTGDTDTETARVHQEMLRAASPEFRLWLALRRLEGPDEQGVQAQFGR